MDELSHNEANEPNKTGNSNNHGNTISTDDNGTRTHGYDKEKVNDQSNAHENETASQPADIDVVVTAH